MNSINSSPNYSSASFSADPAYDYYGDSSNETTANSNHVKAFLLRVEPGSVIEILDKSDGTKDVLLGRLRVRVPAGANNRVILTPEDSGTGEATQQPKGSIRVEQGHQPVDVTSKAAVALQRLSTEANGKVTVRLQWRVRSGVFIISIPANELEDTPNTDTNHQPQQPQQPHSSPTVAQKQKERPTLSLRNKGSDALVEAAIHELNHGNEYSRLLAGYVLGQVSKVRG